MSTSDSMTAIDTVHHATRHYENFTVVSFRQPRRIRDALASIYAYCRHADDLADETGDPAKAIEALNQWEQKFSDALAGNPDHPILEALSQTIHAFDLPQQPFRDLLVAFRQDQTIHRYQTFEDLLGYCRNSANPVGRIILAVFGYRNERFYQPSDAICTGLQLANFWQDVDRDATLGRIYIPIKDLAKYGVSEEDILGRSFSKNFKDLMVFEIARTRQLFEDGKMLTAMVNRDLRWEIEMFRRAGVSVLEGITEIGYDVLHHRPAISRFKKTWIALTSLPALLKKRYHGR
jgi:squalene synthase HpnC